MVPGLPRDPSRDCGCCHANPDRLELWENGADDGQSLLSVLYIVGLLEVSATRQHYEPVDYIYTLKFGFRSECSYIQRNQNQAIQ